MVRILVLQFSHILSFLNYVKQRLLLNTTRVNVSVCVVEYGIATFYAQLGRQQVTLIYFE